MKKYLLPIIVIVLLSVGIVVGLILVQQQQIFKQKASTPTGTATVSISPNNAAFERNTDNTISVYFNTGDVLIQTITARINFSNLSATASNVTINPTLLTSGDWACPVKSVSDEGSITHVDISCAITNTTGYSNNTDTLLATFTLNASQVPVPNPLILSFDPVETIITQKSDATDIALTPSSTGSYTIQDTLAVSPTPTDQVVVPTATATSVALVTATPTATATSQSQATATATATTSGTSASQTPTATPRGTASASGTPASLPASGFDAPTIMASVAGLILLLVGAAALIL